MAGDGRNLRLLHSTTNWPGIDEIVWVPILNLPCRPDSKDRIQPETERTAS